METSRWKGFVLICLVEMIKTDSNSSRVFIDEDRVNVKDFHHCTCFGEFLISWALSF